MLYLHINLIIMDWPKPFNTNYGKINTNPLHYGTFEF